VEANTQDCLWLPVLMRATVINGTRGGGRMCPFGPGLSRRRRGPAHGHGMLTAPLANVVKLTAA
jgi:hypothetical protein